MAEIYRLSCVLYQVWKEIAVISWSLRDCPEIQGLVFGRYAEITGWEKDRSVTCISTGRILLAYLGIERQANLAQIAQAIVDVKTGLQGGH